MVVDLGVFCGLGRSPVLRGHRDDLVSFEVTLPGLRWHRNETPADVLVRLSPYEINGVVQTPPGHSTPG